MPTRCPTDYVCAPPPKVYAHHLLSSVACHDERRSQCTYDVHQSQCTYDVHQSHSTFDQSQQSFEKWNDPPFLRFPSSPHRGSKMIYLTGSPLSDTPFLATNRISDLFFNSSPDNNSFPVQTCDSTRGQFLRGRQSVAEPFEVLNKSSPLRSSFVVSDVPIDLASYRRA
eukprot:CAMPEP_0113846814 /NCGR_PEP_ID=MMETSP0372-20130328/1516_1 /TAXON_ID=340204 /ORGANISM="Lankesteria abbotti" /LENGTH=168 /DNA_ID=CAMNT_0000815999 /DNA_START=1024 /DNA_END=1530 /DNA_ORIENTATION=+ /assembly_acc=CAM_ASM_000359